MKKVTRFLSILLTIAMLASLSVVSVFAAPTEEPLKLTFDDTTEGTLVVSLVANESISMSNGKFRLSNYNSELFTLESIAAEKFATKSPNVGKKVISVMNGEDVAFTEGIALVSFTLTYEELEPAKSYSFTITPETAANAAAETLGIQDVAVTDSYTAPQDPEAEDTSVTVTALTVAYDSEDKQVTAATIQCTATGDQSGKAYTKALVFTAEKEESGWVISAGENDVEVTFNVKEAALKVNGTPAGITFVSSDESSVTFKVNTDPDADAETAASTETVVDADEEITAELEAAAAAAAEEAATADAKKEAAATAATNLETAQAGLETAQAALAEAQAGGDAEAIASAQADVASAEAAVDAAETAKKEADAANDVAQTAALTVALNTATKDGLTPSVELNTESGDEAVIEALQNSLEAALTDENGNVTALADAAGITDDDLEVLGVDSVDELVIVNETSIKATPKSAKQENNIVSVTFDVKAFAQLYATTEEKLDTLDTNQAMAEQVAADTLIKKEAVEVHLEDVPITLTLPVPASFFDEEPNEGYVDHEGTQIAADEVTTSGENYNFVVEEYTLGFSDVTVSAENRSIAESDSNDDIEYTTLQAAVDAGESSVTLTDRAATADADALEAHLDKGQTIKINNSDALGDNAENLKIYNSDGTLATKNKDGSYGKKTTTAGGGGGGGAAANVTTSSATNGTIKVSNTAAKAGEKVTVTLTPSTGYEADTLTVKDKSGATVEATKNADGTYTFTMPAASKLPVSVSATFKKAETKPVDDGTGFIDVAADAYYADAVKWAVGHDPQITNGKDAANTFKPTDVCTRAEAVTFLYRAAGAPDVAVTNQFKDVASDTWYAKAVAWAVANGITNGKDAVDTFKPTDTCSRAEIVTFLARLAKAANTAASTQFKDVAADDYFAGSVAWAVNNGITNGKNAADTFLPKDGCTRAEIVTFLYRDFVK